MGNKFWFAAAVSIAGCCVGCGSDGVGSRERPRVSTQTDLNALGRSLRLHLAVLENMPADCPGDAPFGSCHDADLSLENTGSALELSGWSLYWTSGHRVLNGGTPELGIERLNGSLYRFAPSAAWSGFAAGETKHIPLQAAGCLYSQSEAMPRAYVTAPGLQPVLIPNTDSEDASAWFAPLTTPQQTLCGATDPSLIADAASRFGDNADLQDLGAAAIAHEIVPSPLSMTSPSGAVDLARGLAIKAPALSADTLASITERLAQLDVPAVADGLAVDVTVDPTDAVFMGRPSKEAYRLQVAADGVKIVGADATGAFYVLQSLFGLVPARGAPAALPLVEIPYDAPRYAYRGILIDVARNFHGLPEMLRIMKQMAAYKLNALHLHVSDDEGFRVEIAGLPELTDVGARRCHDEDERTCLLPQLGSGPFDDTSGSGYFSHGDFVALLRSARALGIDVIPEFDLPAHAYAAIRAMAVRSENGDPSYVLRAPGDTSATVSAQSYRANVVDPCLDSTYAFVAKLMDEVLAMYSEAGSSLTAWHVGGDEVPEGSWSSSPACTSLFRSGGEVQGPGDVQSYFMRRVNALARARGIGLRAVNEGMRKPATNGAVAFLDPATDFDGNTASSNWWSTLRWFDDGFAALADRGYQLVLMSADYLFLDHPYEADPNERGLSWATRSIDTRKIFRYISGNLAANRQLLPECPSGGCTDTLLTATPLTKPGNVIGLEAAYWGETIRSDDELQYMVFPRLLALAERAWHRAAWEPADGMDAAAAMDAAALATDWQRFSNTLGHKELPKLDQAGIQYRLEVPGARVVDGALRVNSGAPGTRIQYQGRGGEFVDYDAAEPPSITSTIVRSISPAGRLGRAISVP